MNALKDEMTREKHLSSLRLIVRQDLEAAETRLLPVHAMIPDSMHMMNRTTERVVKMLLLIGAKEHMKSHANLNLYREEVERIVNSKQFKHKRATAVTEDEDEFALGAKWLYPVGETKDLVGDVKMSWSFAKRFLSKIKLLYPCCLPSEGVEDNNTRVTFIRAVDRFIKILEIIQDHNDLSDEQIDALEQEIALFAIDWKDVTGKDGVTNYFHYLTSGHLVYFLRKYRNLYRACQQGWEAMNSWMKVFFLHHTKRGGGDHGRKTYLLPIYRHFQRSYAWRTGFGIEFFKNLPKAELDEPSLSEEHEESVRASDTDIEALSMLLTSAL